MGSRIRPPQRTRTAHSLHFTFLRPLIDSLIVSGWLSYLSLGVTDIASSSVVFCLIGILHLVCPCRIGLSRLSQPVVVASLFARLQVLKSIRSSRRNLIPSLRSVPRTKFTSELPSNLVFLFLSLHLTGRLSAEFWDEMVRSSWILKTKLLVPNSTLQESKYCKAFGILVSKCIAANNLLFTR